MLVYPLPPRRTERTSHPEARVDAGIAQHDRRIGAALAGLDLLLNELDALGLDLAAAHLCAAMDHIRPAPRQ